MNELVTGVQYSPDKEIGEHARQHHARIDAISLGGSNEGVFGMTYEVVGTPDKPTLRVNPLSMVFPGVTRKIWDFNTGKQNNSTEFPNNN